MKKILVGLSLVIVLCGLFFWFSRCELIEDFTFDPVEIVNSPQYEEFAYTTVFAVTILQPLYTSLSIAQRYHIDWRMNQFLIDGDTVHIDYIYTQLQSVTELPLQPIFDSLESSTRRLIHEFPIVQILTEAQADTLTKMTYDEGLFPIGFPAIVEEIPPPLKSTDSDPYGDCCRGCKSDMTIASTIASATAVFKVLEATIETPITGWMRASQKVFLATFGLAAAGTTIRNVYDYCTSECWRIYKQQ